MFHRQPPERDIFDDESDVDKIGVLKLGGDNKVGVARSIRVKIKQSY